MLTFNTLINTETNYKFQVTFAPGIMNPNFAVEIFEPGSIFWWHRSLHRTLVLQNITEVLTANTLRCKTRDEYISPAK